MTQKWWGNWFSFVALCVTWVKDRGGNRQRRFGGIHRLDFSIFQGVLASNRGIYLIVLYISYSFLPVRLEQLIPMILSSLPCSILSYGEPLASTSPHITVGDYTWAPHGSPSFL